MQANASPPVLRTHDRYGHRIDEVEYHPAYHELMRLAVGHGLHALPWREPRAGAHVARAAMFYVTCAGRGRPRLPDLDDLLGRAGAARRAEARARVGAAPHLDALRPAASRRRRRRQGAICGMAMTEKQGGSDVRANTTRADADAATAAALITGHKWFCSAPMCDAFLVLAQTAKGVTCFLMPRWLPDGTRNRFHIQRLKDKLGNRSNASSEVEFDGAWARLRRRRGSRRADHHRDGQPHAARLRDRRRRRHAPGGRAGDPSRRSTAAPSASGSSSSR